MDQIQTYLSSNPTFNIDALVKFIYSQIPNKPYHHRIHYKKYPEHNLVQLFTESSQEYSKNTLFNACRSILFDTVNNKIVSFSHPNIEYVNKLPENLPEMSFTESHEGTLISVFYYNNKWFYATRREIDMYKTHKISSNFKSELSHGLMFEDALSKLNITKEVFESRLNPENQYYIELVHYQNTFNISFESRFADNYAKLFLLFVRNGFNVIPGNIEGIENNPILTMDQVKSQLSDVNMVVEGYIYLSQTGNLCKVLHSMYYEKMKFNPGLRTPQELYIYLYQKDLLSEYVTKNNKVVYKTTDLGKEVEIKGLMSCIFLYISQRLLDIYYNFNTNTMIHKQEELFKKLFQENNNKYYLIFHVLGMMKGIHKNKQLNILEMKKLIKYKLIASDVWKVFNEIKVFENTENILTPWLNPLIKLL
jgi:hypothetical protein